MKQLLYIETQILGNDAKNFLASIWNDDKCTSRNIASNKIIVLPKGVM